MCFCNKYVICQSVSKLYNSSMAAALAAPIHVKAQTEITSLAQRDKSKSNKTEFPFKCPNAKLYNFVCQIRRNQSHVFVKMFLCVLMLVWHSKGRFKSRFSEEKAKISDFQDVTV